LQHRALLGTLPADMAVEADVLKQAQDFLRFYVQGGAAVLQADLDAIQAAQGDPAALQLATSNRTQLVTASDQAIRAALQAFDPLSGPASTIESNPLAAFVATPGIARRIPAIRGTAPDFIPVANSDLVKNTFQPQNVLQQDPATVGLVGPLVPAPDTPSAIPPRPGDQYVDMCAVEDVVVTSSSGLFQVSVVWVQDYPAEVLESGAVPDPTRVADTALPRVRAVVDQAQPSVIATECMEALQAFLGQDVFEEFDFTAQAVLCSFEQLDATVATLKGG